MSEYRYKHFTMRTLFNDMHFTRSALSGLSPRQHSIGLLANNPRKVSRRAVGAVTMRSLIWLFAWVRALMAESLVLFSILSILTLPVPTALRLGYCKNKGSDQIHIILCSKG